VPLVDKLEEPVEYNEEDWEIVFTSDNEYEVDMMKDNLDGAGISSMILDQKDRNFPATGDLAIIKLLVKKEDVPSAVEFVSRYKDEKNPDEEEL